MTAFSDLIPTAQRFYAALDRDNSRDWWQANRGPYDDVLKPGALALLDALAPAVQAQTGHPVTTKLFRPNRDVRFSADKRPYQTHLHMLWHVDAGGRQDPALFFGVDIDRVRVGAGLMGLDKPVLEDWRKRVDRDTDAVLALMDRLEAQGYAFGEPALKRVPAPYPQDHPAGEWLRRKSVTAFRDLAPEPDLETAMKAAFAELDPLLDLLIDVAR